MEKTHLISPLYKCDSNTFNRWSLAFAPSLDSMKSLMLDTLLTFCVDTGTLRPSGSLTYTVMSLGKITYQIRIRNDIL